MPEGRRGPTAHLSVHLDGLLLQGSGLRLLRSGFSSAPGAPWRAPSRSSNGSPRTTRKPWSRAQARPPGSVCGQIWPTAPGAAARSGRRGRSPAPSCRSVSPCSGRTRDCKAPPPGENVQREAGTPAGPGRARRPGPRPPHCARRRRRVPLGSARRRHVDARRRGPFAHFLRRGPSPARRWGSQRSGHASRAPAGALVARALRQLGVAWGSPVLPGVLAFSPGSGRGRPQPGQFPLTDCTDLGPATRPRPPLSRPTSEGAWGVQGN